MNQSGVPSVQNSGKVAISYTSSRASIIFDIKALLKGKVLVANVLPVFAGFWLALYFTGSSFSDNWGIFWLTMIGSTMIIAGALVINNWYDVDIDTVMDRTKHRPTVTGNFSLKAVLWTGIILTVLGFILMFFTRFEAVIYSFIGWFTYVVLYTMWSKRRYTLNTVIGSISGAVTPMIGWTAIDSGFHIVPIIMFLILFIFQMPHTFAVAMKKCEEYRAAKVAMLPVVHGFDMTKRQMVVYIACLLPLPFYLGSLGTTFVVIATIMNIGWLVVSIYGLFTKNDLKWAHVMFLYSVNYITLLFLLMIVVTLPVFQ
ncbi:MULTISPECIES: heme o synthase [Neobacillus]|jgi:heme o synthase|uniref:Protoheme IX farnesyltransferase n=1 Tax=Neobacillus sedimentimangrovi TaxID=2699460 RepID=A0ABS8QM33_9BACI|nr:heme o synthase [Neobacillus sedimentimangrovi]MCD4840338.1 heme o synthase [Neobacillus sedimentimangrovi]